MRYNDYSDEESCGKRVPGELSDRYDDLGGLACMRTQGHEGECISTAGDAGRADGVHCWCCRMRLELDHHDRCPLQANRKNA
jgi:hypothetical protein